MDLIIIILPVVTKDLPISPRLFIAMQVQQSCNSSTNGWILLTTHVPTISVTEKKNTNPTLVRIELTTSALADVQIIY